MNSKITQIIFSTVILVLTHTVVLACKCGNRGAFFNVAPETELVVIGKVTKQRGRLGGIKLSMDVKIDQIFHGDEKKSKILVYGDNGMLCRPYIKTFPKGSRWILALDYTKMNKLGEKEDGYSISVCGTYWLKVEDDMVIGNIEESEEGETIEEFTLKEFQLKFKEALNKLNNED